jgi:hypothetical protein
MIFNDRKSVFMDLHRFVALCIISIFVSLGFVRIQSKAHQENSASIDTIRATATNFSEIVRREMLQLEDSVTLGKWRILHPYDSLVPFGYELKDDIGMEWCMRADWSFLLPSGKTAYRRAYFYAPPPSHGLKLPILKDSVRVRTTEPILGMLLVQLAEGSRDIGESIADSARQRLCSVFGIGKIDEKLWGYGSSGWTHTNRWQSGNRIFASAYGLNLDYGSEPKVFACGFLPISDFHVDFNYNHYSSGGTDTNIDSLIYERSIKLLGQYRENANALMQIYSSRRHSPNTPVDIKGIVNPFRQWIKLFKNTDPHQRAAALVFADQILKPIEGSFNIKDTVVISEFRQLGADIRESRTMGWIYESSWLKEARTLDPKGPMGDLALMIMMQRGFQLDAGISDCGRCFIKIIREGEELLERSNDEELRTWTHFKLGYAYSDVVAIESGYPTLTENDTSFQMSAEVARQKAITHFQEAFSVDSVSTKAYSAWREAWRLVAAIPPKQTMFTFVDE